VVSRNKIWSGFSLEPLATAGSEVPVIVSYRPSADRVARVQGLDGVAPQRHYRVLPFVAARVTAAGLYNLEQDPAVDHIWPDLPVRVHLDKAVPYIHAPAVWFEGPKGHGVRVAIVDTGIDANHPDLQGRVTASADFTGEGPNDGHGHGTHVAGIVAGSGAASGGRYRGVAPEAELCAAKVLRSDGSGMTSTVIAGLEWAAEQSVHVVNLSLGNAGSSDGTDALSYACDTIMAKGIVVCVAAGNEGPGNYSIGSPGAARQVITVGACTLDRQVAEFSSRGPTRDGRAKPDLLLPGVTITSCRAAGTKMGSPVDEYYTCASGTSMATPLAAGLAALLVEAFPDLRAPDIKERLKSAAIDLKLSPYAQGAGLADALRAYQGEQGPPVEAPVPPPPPAGCLLSAASLLGKAIGRELR